MAFDASPSWSGFNYQGKVALYCTLRQINSLPLDTNFFNMSLILENHEDFEIHDKNNIISFHQVKAINSSSFSNYSNALLEFTLELSKQPNVQGKIHTWKNINSKTNCTNIVDSLRSEIKSIIDEFEASMINNGNSVIEKATQENKNKQKNSAIIGNAFPYNSAQEICNILKDIVNNKNNALSRLEAYVYDDGNSFCDLDSINDKIKTEISTLLGARNLINNNERCIKTFYYFLGMMDSYIIQRHKTKGATNNLSITFTEIINAVTQDHEDISLKYFSLKFKEHFINLIDEYINDSSYISFEESHNLNKLNHFFLSVDSLDLWSYYIHFSPHISLQEKNITDISINIDKSGIRFGLLNIFDQLDHSSICYSHDKYKILYETKTRPIKRFIPSTIMASEDFTPLSYIEKQISKNINMIEYLYEIENIIYKGSVIHKFSPSGILHTEAPMRTNETTRSKRNDMLTEIKLIPIPDAKLELNL